MSDLPSVAQSAEDAQLLQSLWNANTTRYLSAVGLVVLIYDHILTFDKEYRFVWKAPSSAPKFGFLFNRYLVLGCQLAVATEMCGFHGPFFFTDQGCRSLLITTTVAAVISIAIANILVLLRVVILWDRNPIVVRLMTAGFLSTLVGQVVMMVLALRNLEPGVVWSPVAKICAVTTTSHFLPAIWGVPLSFEALVLLATIVNALDRPRTAHVGIIGSLYRDGISYFVVLTCLRLFNLILATRADPSLTLLGVFMVWSLTTTVLSRSLFGLRQAEVSEDYPPSSGRASPFTVTRNKFVDMTSFIDLEPYPQRRESTLKDGV